MSEYSPGSTEVSGGEQIAVGLNRVLGVAAGIEAIDALASGKPVYALVGVAAVYLSLWNDSRMRPQPVQQEQ